MGTSGGDHWGEDRMRGWGEGGGPVKGTTGVRTVWGGRGRTSYLTSCTRLPDHTSLPPQSLVPPPPAGKIEGR